MFLPSNITLQFGDSGDFVMELQRRLATVNAHGHDAVNGFYDGTTVNSVSSFQSRNGLRADGIAGPETLRKLNGVVSGETDTATEDKKEEEEKQLHAAQAVQEFYHLDQQEPMSPHPVVAEEVAHDIAAAGAGELAATMEHAHHAAHSATPTIDPQQMQQQLQHEVQFQQHAQQQHQQQAQHQHQQHAQPISGDMLAQMLVQQTAAAHHAPPQQAATAHPPAAAPAAHAPAPHHPAPEQPPVASAPAAAAHEQPAPEQPRGLVGRAIQKMDAFLQKLADHFESKLPPHVLNEVKNIGSAMMQSGVREAAIPTGPEQARAPATPGRGPEQQQIPQRG